MRFWQLLGISLGHWRSMSIFILNMPFAIKKCISVSDLSSKMNRRLVWQKAMRIKQYLPTYNASIYLCTECSEQEKIPQIQICYIIFAANLIRIAICGLNQEKIRKLLVFVIEYKGGLLQRCDHSSGETHRTIRSASLNAKVIAYSCCHYKRKKEIILLKNFMFKL